MNAQEPAALILEAGGTKTGLALVSGQSGNPVFLAQDEVKTWGGHSSLPDAAKPFLARHAQHRVCAVCTSYAGPVREGSSRGRNMPWAVTEEELAAAFSLERKRVHLVNDSVATGRGALLVAEQELIVLQPGKPEPGENRAGATLGTGNGRFQLRWDATRQCFDPSANEGSHAPFGITPCSDGSRDDVALWRFLHELHGGYVSWETVCSGPGIYDLYRYLLAVRFGQSSPTITTEAEQSADPAAVIATHAQQDEVCAKAMLLFAWYCGQAVGNDILGRNAWDGYYLSGGVFTKNVPWFVLPIFQEGFMARPQDDQDQLRSVRIWGISDSKLAIRGAAALALELAAAA